MKLLIINCGSSSVKYKIFQDNKTLEAKIINGVKDFHSQITQIIENLNDIDAVAHRVVHGGEEFSQPTLIDENVIKKIKQLFPLAPLHNPINLKPIEIILKNYPNLIQIAVFDTAFHQTIPKKNFLYPLPLEFYENHHIRRYGFHGSSHEYITNQVATHLNKPISKLNIISLHLGNGASITAIKNGKSYDTTMGFTPLEGLMMGTRCGDIDPSIILYLQNNLGYSANSIDRLLNKQSGFLGLCDESDFQKIWSKRSDSNVKIAINIYIDRIIKYIGYFILKLQKVDAIVFTGGIGENSQGLRKKVLNKLHPFGIKFSKIKNKNNYNKILSIHKEDSTSKVFAVKTDEEFLIYQKSCDIIQLQN